MDVATVTDGKKRHASGDEYPAMPGIFNVPRMFGFPPRIITRMRYNAYVTLTATSLVGNTFNMTSIFDPDTTGVGHQPMYHDQFANIYAHYTVLGSKIRAEFVTISGTTPAVVGIMEGDDTTFPTDVNSAAEQNKATRMLLGGASSMNKGTLTATYGAVDDEGIDPYSGSELVRTPFGMNPTENYYSRVYAVAYDAITSTPVFVAVYIEYTVLLSELLDVTGS